MKVDSHFSNFYHYKEINKYNELYTADIQEDKGISHVTTKAIYHCGLLHSDLGET